MRRTYQILGLLITVSLLVSCSKSSFDYLGKSYPPTANPELYFRDQDVPRDYEVMGKVMAEVPYKKKLKYLQTKIEQVAAQNGADAFLLSDVQLRSVGYTQSSGGASGGKGWFRAGGGVSKTNKNEMKKIEATLLKYK